MKRIALIIIFFLSAALYAALPAKKAVAPKKIKVVTTLSVLASLTRELGEIGSMSQVCRMHHKIPILLKPSLLLSVL